MNKTIFPKQSIAHPQWFIIDAQEQTLGRISTKIAQTLLGKNNILYTPGYCAQQRVIVVNAKMVKVTGKKKLHKLYCRHTGRPGGFHVKTFEEITHLSPFYTIEQSVKRMLPKNPYGRKLFTKLEIYKDSHHPHTHKKLEKLTP
ncbi:ribosomal protein L13 (plastid) [Cryptomonas paramecium]|uniref:Ribosomal protein L13 n=1 Tax=Cryptomonas paramaecium TaxID=2898 RepID=D2ISB6_9CRYP|nr:ribosomal protein L13 [Cryptomonas paramecium]ACT46808.1 ribosomal protein L13 [Cryptomonas paramecium]BDA97987.1 ribosomal protein L13 [Cryptomonas paramecium]